MPRWSAIFSAIPNDEVQEKILNGALLIIRGDFGLFLLNDDAKIIFIG